MSQTASSPAEPIAIVGSGLRFPGGANSRSSLWELLETTPDLCREIPTDRFSTTGFYHSDGARHGTTNVRHTYLLDEDIRVFDAAFFNISANEAESIDPQQRILLETVYEALEAGGHTLEALRGSDTSVYVGTMTVDYLDTLLRDHNTIPKYFATGINRAIISNRVSYFFDWHGPSMTIDTACSSSLIAVHQGVQSLRNSESRVSVACGTQVLLGYDMYIGESKLKMLSPNGRSRMWDADADGYARGEGVAAIVMKRLSDAIADGDHIECIIRETGANQDGASNGLTVPSSVAQAALIRSTYARAGLDPENRPADRPQYFEAHGTGTQAGDPKEAAAIHDAFGRLNDAEGRGPLYVGSIKTVIGHLEGAAGLAGLLKASASLQKGAIPPNLSFHHLNPKLEPFYKGLHVPTKQIAWPVVPDGAPRRASVNSFGFGGANAHAILEAYTPPNDALPSARGGSSGPFAPFVFSAQTETSLVSLLERYSQFLKATRGEEPIDASDLSWTLHSRRSRFPARVTFPVSSVERLIANIDVKLAAARASPGTAVGARSVGRGVTPRVLGVFTGQGAQWPAMGASLIRASGFVGERVQHLEESLATLPPGDRPDWSLREQMLADAKTSRIAEAALSQPLCTAIQVVLVDLLREAGVTFSSVVGHSSGEIAAAYAAGFFSARDAIRIAYYRGLYAKLAGNAATDQKGAMMAVGLSFEEAQELVSLPQFKGRLAVAAYNSSASITLSGDADAIAEAKVSLDEQKKFARLLKVDTAYHSHHMIPCGEKYVAALRACGVKVIRERDNSCSWFSSVAPSDRPVQATEDLQDLYWRDNMANTVLFADAVRNAVTGDERINVALEIGPHPALKGPTLQNLGDMRPSPIPYSGVLSRGNDDIESFSDALGLLWTMFGADSVDLPSFDRAVAGDERAHRLVVDLPSYQWDHGRAHWSESRRSKKIRTRKDLPHELLGVLSPESNARDMRWLNVLKVSEIAWMEGHQLQGLVVFPAAGYVAMGVEACRKIAGADNVQLFEIHDLSIPRAVTFEEGDTGVETLVTITAIEHHADRTITADLSIYAGPCVSTGSEHDLELVASADVKIVLGDPDLMALPYTVSVDDHDMSDVDPDRIYTAFSKLGYGYTGAFRGLSSAKRRLNRASAMVDTYAYSDEESTFYLVHPGTLDVAIQSVMLAYAAPGDGRLWSLHVPTGIRSIRINPMICDSLPASGCKIPITTVLSEEHEFSASIDILGGDGQYGMIQVEDMALKPFAPATKAEDRWMYSSTELNVAAPDAIGLVDTNPIRLSSFEADLVIASERIAFYYLRKWKDEITDSEWASSLQHFGFLHGFIDHTLSRVSSGQHPSLRREWANDSAQEIELLTSQYLEDSTVELIRTVGQNLPAAVRGQTSMIDHLGLNAVPRTYYSQDVVHKKYQLFLAGMVKQITYRYPHAKILEIGAGAGEATRSILEAITSHGGAVPSYTFTDASPEAIQKAVDTFKVNNGNMTFKTLDIEQAPNAQDFALNSYDIVVTSNSLHTTPSLQKSLENVRQLLKPGGYLVSLELTDVDCIRFPTISGGLPTWWLGVDDGRKYGPAVPPAVWNQALRKAGFGGIDTVSPKVDGSALASPFSVMAAQAVDEQTLFLRRPLSAPSSHISLDNLVILGSAGIEGSRIADELSGSLARFCGNITVLDGLPTEAEALTIEPMSTFVNLVDLDTSIFKGMTDNKMAGLKHIFRQAKHVLWLTRGVHLGEDPYHAASLAFCRSLANEVTHVSVNVLDISGTNANEPRVVAEQLLRQCALEEWDERRLTWSKEPETFLRDGKLLLPRILPNRDQNARLNAVRRVIREKVPVRTSRLSIVPELVGSSTCVVTGGQLSKPTKDGNETTVEVKASTLFAIQAAPDTFLYLSVGKVAGEEHTVIAASTTNSRATVPVLSVPGLGADGTVDADRLLIAVSSELLATSLVQGIAPGSSVLVHCTGADRFFAAALNRLAAAANDVRVSFVCVVDSTEDSDPSWIRLSPRASRNVARRSLLPIQPTHFLDLTMGNGPQNEIAAVLPSRCRRLEPSSLFQPQAFLPHPFQRDIPVSILQDAVTGAQESLNVASSAPGKYSDDLVLALEQVNTDSVTRHATSVVHWPVGGEVEAEVRPLDCSSLFSPHKTYILFGLSGQIGQSLCEWMVYNGAGCVVLTSRRPNVNQRWLESFAGTKSTVKVMSADVTDQAVLDAFLKTIKETCPPIGGIANGANVLSDGPFDSMSSESMNRALGPKIEGSYNLDQAFYNDDLDFFVLFSSISCVIGTAGQSNYTAANGYLNGLARQRRGRGLAASAFDIGLILGIGIAEVAGQSVVDSLQKYGITPLSEPDVRLAFAESILAGYVEPADKTPGSAPAAVMTSGLRTITIEEKDMVWYENPIFSHLVIDAEDGSGANDSSRDKAASLPVKDQIAAAVNKEEAFEMLKECFAHRLRVLLGSADEEIAYDTPLVELGIDSLIAVEVRSWFLKSLKVDIPVLKILGGSSLEETCEQAMKKLPDELTAQIGTAGAVAVSGSPAKAQSAKQSRTTPKPAPAPKAASTTSSDSGHATTSSQDRSIVEMNTSAITRQTSFASLRTQDKQENRDRNRKFVKSEPISVGQSRFWFLRLLVDDPTTFNVALKFRMVGHIRVGDLERAVSLVSARHESLRTCFIGDEHEADQASQSVLGRSLIKLERKSVNSEEEVTAEYERLRAHEFDLARGPLLRVMLVTLSPMSHYLLVNYDHIIMDMASFQVFTAELEKTYNGQPLGPLPRQYPDFSVAQRRSIEQGELNDELEYWRGIFPAGKQPPVLPLLPMARSNARKAMSNYDVHQVSIPLDPTLAAQVKSVSKAQRSTPFHFYLAAFKAMLFAFTDAEDLTIGIADANRNEGDVMGSIGFFLNLLTLRFQRKPKQAFADAIVEARTTAYGALGNSRLPFDVLLKELNVARSSLHSPFFQAFFDYRQQTRDRETWCNCQFELDELHPGRTAYDISLDVADLGSNVHLTLRVQKGLYDLSAANLLLETYSHFVVTCAQNVKLLSDEIPLFSEKQLTGAIQVGIGPELVTDWPSTLPHRIDQMAEQNADQTALEDGHGAALTYADMIKRVEAIAEIMSKAGVGSGCRVLVFQQATVDWICSLLAIMRIGGVYVPLDLRNPIERLAAQANHCKPSAVLVDDTTMNDATRLDVAVIIDVSHVPQAPAAPVPNQANPNEPAAILYTSGSTGTPKGIVIRHSGIRNEMEGYTKTYKLGAERVLQQSAFTFDFSVDQIFTGLVNGGSLYIVPWSKRGDPLSITEIMKEQKITYTKVTPSEYSMWMQYGNENLVHATSWRFAFAGGEPMIKTMLQQFSDLDLPLLRLFNSYGPAEISIASHKGFIDYRKENSPKASEEESPVVCGFSLPNYATYILDENLKPLPIGMPGEVVIGGAGVSFGYLANTELTAHAFVPNPYADSFHAANGWTQMHRTGDIGHLQEDGSLVFRNRIAGDTQVKVRGLRIDLRDIEMNMISTASGALKDAVVTLRDGDPPLLVAHVVFSPQAEVGDREVFLEQLLARLPIPQYMIPVVAVPLDKLPLTNHSKADRKAIKALALPQRTKPVDDSQPDGDDMTETMLQLRQVWRQLLPDSRSLGLAMTASTNFFQVGGNSLLIVRLQSRIRHAFNVVIRLVDLLGASTLGQMARKIEESPGADPIDWDVETAPPTLPAYLRDLPPKPRNPSEPMTLLLTGATGNLARHLLPVLAADPRVGEIHCVAVRDRPRAEGALPPNHPKISTHVGDLSLPLLGLGVDEFRGLAARADAVLHLGAARSFWDNYATLRATNVHSTRELVKLAAARRIPIHFVSSSGVLAAGDATTPASAAARVPPTDGSGGYLASKWAGERILERAGESEKGEGLGVPSSVFRLLPLASSPGMQAERAKSAALEELERCIALAGAVPDAAGWEGRIDLLPAAVVSRWLSEALLGSSSPAPPSGEAAMTLTRFAHLESTVTIRVNELVALVERVRASNKEAGGPTLASMQVLKWMGRIKALGFAYILASQEVTVQGATGKLLSRR